MCPGSHTQAAGLGEAWEGSRGSLGGSKQTNKQTNKQTDVKGQKTILQLSEQFGKGPVEKARSTIFKWHACQLSEQF